ncbi:histidine phosphatase family protein [Gluconobacter sp. Dm-62]|nr:histidine phosphatase family protein [Gluconobacter sp. Dm-62]MBS1103594.1 histidine phosphatase family protein [Gluconobacter sp. Dm-62]
MSVQSPTRPALSGASGSSYRLPVLLIRHPPVEGMAGQCYGRTDVPLQSGWTGLARGLSIVARGAGCRVVASSPSGRCRLLAEQLAVRGGMELRIDPRLAELDFGAWEGLAWNDLPRADLDHWAADPEGFSPPGGESGEQLLSRARYFWKDLTQAQEPVCVVSHGGPLRILNALAEGREPSLLAASMPQGTARLHRVRYDASERISA